MAEKKKKGPGGRPTRYKKSYCKKIIEFFDKDPFEETTRTIASYGKPVEIDVEKVTELPLLCKFAVDIGVNRSTLREWAEKHPEFSIAYSQAKELQRNLLITNGLMGRYNSKFASLAAKNMIGWRDQLEQKIEVQELPKIEIVKYGSDKKD